MTLSVSRDKKVEDGEVGLPGAEKARKMLVKETPGKFKNAGGMEDWGVRALSEDAPVRDGLIAVLEEKGWFCPADSLKTQLIMENC